MTGRAKLFLNSLSGRYPSPPEAKLLYRLRDKDVTELQRKKVITQADVETLEWGGRFRVANESFDKCEQDAQEILRNDPDHRVRAAVVTFKPWPAPIDHYAGSSA